MVIFYLFAAVCLLAAYIIWQYLELQKFNCTAYELHTPALQETHRWVVLSDVHLWQYGVRNERLLAAIRAQAPEAILFPGDLIVNTKPEHFGVAEELMAQLVQIAPVYFSNGNHESRLEQVEHPNFEPYQRLKAHMQSMGVHILNNTAETLTAGADTITIHGLELPLAYYKKGVDTPLAEGELNRLLGEPRADGYHILLAHTPKYIPEYFAWGADLCLSGHYHGGLVCIPVIGSVISPQFELFPKYSFGRFDEQQRTALVSRGLGTHTFHIRIFNRGELLVVTAGP